MEMELPTSLLCRGVRKAADLTKPIDKRVYKVRFCLRGTWISNMLNPMLVSTRIECFYNYSYNRGPVQLAMTLARLDVLRLNRQR